MTPRAHGNFAGRRLIVFGCGYVGSAVAEVMRADGAQVTCVTRNGEAAMHLRTRGFSAVVADVTGSEWYDEVDPAPDFVLNCLSSGGGGVEAYRSSYVDGMYSILEWAATSGSIGTLVYTSSTSVYPQDGGAVVDETAAVGGGGRAEILVEAERLLQTGAVCDRWFILRLAGIYGPGRHHLLQEVRLGAVSGSGEYHLNLAHRDDIVAAIRACFSAPESVRNHVLNVADDGAATKREIVEWIAAESGLPMPTFTGLPAGSRRALTADRVISNRKLKELLGWAPGFSSFREGYRAILSEKQG